MPADPRTRDPRPSKPASPRTRGPGLYASSIGCLLALLTGFTPRLVLVLVWLFGNDVERAFDSFIVPLLGLFLLPLTTLMYAITWAPRVGPEGFDWFLIVLAFLIDLSSYGGAAAGRARRGG